MTLTPLVCGLLLAGPLLLVQARGRNDPARLVRGQEEWPEHVGCPTGYVVDMRPKAQKQFRPGYIICAKGNYRNCVLGTKWFMLDGKSCLECKCHDGNTGDCNEVQPCPPPKPRFPTHHHYNCRKRDRKVCPSEKCTFLSREPRCVNCDCDGVAL
ncbi:uncharacterized protein LOC119099278 [Pollicipes pollicipes]|uniref:uncharacterized protein LOC119099278 n=1 Tax=Pollicipes pollicipes TaxID=41117 RepID=UPI00188577CC|nr:uncharacterized protein LOC119099278 [Pollicipes pollicipes]